MNQGLLLIHRGLVVALHSRDVELIVEGLLLLFHKEELILKEVAVLQAGPTGHTADIVDVGGLLDEHCWLGKVLV